MHYVHLRGMAPSRRQACQYIFKCSSSSVTCLHTAASSAGCFCSTCANQGLKSFAVPADKLSPFKFYQYLLTNVGDEEVIAFLRMLTFVPLDDIEALKRSMQEPGYKPNTVQRLLATEVTSFVHGQQGLDQALKATEVDDWAQAPVRSHLAL